MEIVLMANGKWISFYKVKCTIVMEIFTKENLPIILDMVMAYINMLIRHFTKDICNAIQKLKVIHKIYRLDKFL